MDNYAVAYHVSELPEVSTPVLGYSSWSCVSYAKYKRPDQDFVWLYPNNVKAYDIEPFKGALVLTTEGAVGHVAYVESVTDTALEVSEANYVPGLVTRRTIPRDAPYIRGYR